MDSAISTAIPGRSWRKLLLTLSTFGILVSLCLNAYGQHSAGPVNLFDAGEIAPPSAALQNSSAVTSGMSLSDASIPNEPSVLIPEEGDADDLLLQSLLNDVAALQNRIKTLEDEKSSKEKKPEEKKKTYPNAKITGFTQLDGGLFDQSEVNKETVGNMQNGLGFRRARLAITGGVSDFTRYQLEMDFATAGRPSFFDTWIEQSNLPVVGTAKIGQYCQPFSVDALTGFRNLIFLERSLPFLAFVPFRRVGGQFADTSDDEMTQWAVSLFRTGGYKNAPLGDNRYATDIGDVGGISLSTRVTHLIAYDQHANDAYLWHLGASYNLSFLGADTAEGSTTKIPFYRTRVLPEFGLLGYSEDSQPFGFAYAGTPSFIDSGQYPADAFHLFGLETVWQNGPWGAQAEWMATVVDSMVGNIFYNGAYAQLAYRLTGEHREYNKKTGTLGRLVPKNDFYSFKDRGIQGWGAWEVAGRLSFVDIRNPDSLNGHYLNGSSAIGNGTLVDSTLGFTWFINVHTKIQGNWIHCMLDNVDKGNSTANLFVTRFQVDF